MVIVTMGDLKKGQHMAPRTEAQQIAYNAKLRAETAARNADKTVVTRGKPKPKAKNTPRTGKTSFKGKPPHTMLVKAMAKKAKSNGHAKPVETRDATQLKAFIRAHEPKTAKTAKTAKVTVKIEDKAVKLSPVAMKPPPPQVTYTDAPGVTAYNVMPASRPVVQEAAPPAHTMARSYVRSGGAGRGKLRGKTYQATVSFTADQMDQVVAAAGFRNVSLAEMIRSCVVEHLNKGAPNV